MWDSTNPYTEDQKPNQIFMTIKEDFYWDKNYVALDPEVFDYKKFEDSGWNYDCHDYGVFVFTKNETA